ncbi:MAG: SprB repeat-containing protein, partial [Bacteroidota bacterium]
MYKLFALPLLLCIGMYSILTAHPDDTLNKNNPNVEYDLACMEVELKTQPVRCFGFCDGVLEVIVTGGQPPYTYEWSNGLTTNFSATLPAGEFTVTVRDAAGCEVTATARVGSPTEIKPNLQIEGSCDPNTPTTASVSPRGGVGNYIVEWSTGETERSITNLANGAYSVTITTRGNGCSVTEDFVIADGLTVDAEKTDIACGNTSTGSATATALGGQAPYTYQWSNGFSETTDGTSTIEDLAAGTYTITVTDAGGCEGTATVEVVDSGGLNLELDSAPTTCKEDEDGMANAIPSGGTPPYRYEWSDGQTTGSAIGLAAGTYSVTVTDMLSCQQEGMVVVTSSSNLKVTAAIEADNESVTVTATGGVEPYTYEWDNGETTPTATAYSAGDTYSVKVTDALGCMETVTGELPPEENSEPEITITKVDPKCSDSSDGTIEASVTDGTAPYTYEWSNGASTPSIENLTAGTYMLTVTDANGSRASATIELVAPSAIDVNLSVEILSVCDVSEVGSASVAPTGGTGELTIAWSTGESTTSIQLAAGQDYSVTITDENDCTAEESFTTPTEVGLSIELSKTDETCKADADGTASVSVTNGTAPFTYAWSNGATTAELEGLAADTYTVTVTDANDCSASQSITIEAGNMVMVATTVEADETGITATATGGTEPYTYEWDNGETTSTATGYPAGTPFSLTVTDAEGCTGAATGMIPDDEDLNISITTMPPSCAGFGNGSIMANVSGGTAPYTYRWSNRATTASIFGLDAGTYSVTVTDANGETATTEVTLTEPDPVVVTIEPTSGDVCDGENTDYEANVSGGTSPYTFAWSNGNTSSTLSGVAAGDYFLTVTDANNCEAVAFLKVSPPLEVEVIGQAVRCNDFCDGSVRAAITGGTGPFTFVWSNGQTDQILENLPVGTYTVTVTDANGCTATATGEVTAPPAIESNLQIDGTCDENSTNTASVDPTGGVGNYTIRWSTGEMTNSISNLIAGESYSVKITDANGCSLTEEFTIPTDPGLVVNAEKTDITCNNTNSGTATANVLSGTAPYTYAWSNGQTETTSSTTNTIENLAAGTYTVTITDADDCQGIASVTIEETDGLNLSLSSTNAICEDDPTGMANVVPTGGMAPYTYQWSDGQTNGTATNLVPGTYSVTVTDIMGCEGIGSVTVEQGTIITVAADIDETNNEITVTPSGGTEPYTYAWDNGETTQTATNYQAGDTYSVTVTDADGCDEVVTGELPSTEGCQVTIDATPPSCPDFSDGSLTAVLSASCPEPFTYEWSTGQTSVSITGLTGGEYSVTVTNADGESVSTTITLVNPDPIVVDIQATSGDICDGTNTDYEANVSGGTMPYTFAWSNGNTSSTLSGVAAGDYFLTVTDANNCEAVTFLKVSPPLEVEVIGQAVRCNDFCDGSVRAAITGGTGPFTFTWSNGQTDQILENLPVGTYTVTVTDANGCTATATGEVTAPPAIESNLLIDGTCDENSTNTATVNPTGGVGNYTIRWSTGETGTSISNLEAGQTYTVTIKDGNGCDLTEEFTIPAEPGLVVNGSKTDIACNNSNTGTATATVLSGEAPYTYEWSNGTTETTSSTTASIENLAAGTYTVTITDANGCEGTTTVTVEENDGLNLDLSSTNTLCEDGMDGMANVVPSGGTAPYRYQWSDGQTFGTATGLAAGEYSVTVTDLLGCTGIGMVTVEPEITIELSVIVDTVNNGITVNPSSNSEGTFTYLWSNGETTQTATGYQSCEDYSVTVTISITDSNGNPQTCQKTIDGKTPCGPNEPSISIVTTPTCETGADAKGTATITIEGGAAPYTIQWGEGNEAIVDGGTFTIENLAIGTYDLSIIDSEGNTFVRNFTIEETQILVKVIESSTIAAACNAADGSVSIEVSGGSDPYQIIWETNVNDTILATTSTLENLAAGSYQVTVIDENGCSTQETVEVPEDNPLVLTPSKTDIPCDQSVNGTASIEIAGGSGDYSISWSTGASNVTNLVDLGEGTYTVTVTDNNSGCERTTSISIEEA